MSMSTPLKQSEQEILDQFMAASAEHDPENHTGICLVRSVRKRDGKDVALLCRSTPFEDGVQLYPLAAIIVTKEDLDEYEPPKP